MNTVGKFVSVKRYDFHFLYVCTDMHSYLQNLCVCTYMHTGMCLCSSVYVHMHVYVCNLVHAHMPRYVVYACMYKGVYQYLCVCVFEFIVGRSAAHVQLTVCVFWFQGCHSKSGKTQAE